MPHLYQKTKGGTFFVRFRDNNGQQKNRSLHTTDERKALKLLLELEDVLKERNTPIVHVSKRSLGNNPEADTFWEWFIGWCSQNRSKRAAEEYSLWWRQYRDFSAFKHLGDVTVAKVEAFKAALLEQGKKKPEGVGLKKSSVNNALKTLQAIWSIAIRCHQYDGDNPFSHVERFKIPKGEDKGYLAQVQIDSLLDAAKKYRSSSSVRPDEATNVYLAIALMAEAGLRKGEACWLRWEDIDLDARIIRVTNHDDFTTKNLRPRRVPINDRLLQVLGPYKRDEGYVLSTTRQSEGKFRYRADFKKSFKQVCSLAEIQTIPHQLRHSFISRHANAGTPLHKIAGWVGHSTTWITERYGHYQMGFDEAANNIATKKTKSRRGNNK